MNSPVISIVTYNTHLLPALAMPLAGNRSNAKLRARRIAEAMAEYDIVGLCEVFDPRRRKELLEQIDATSTNRKRHVHFGPPRSGRALTGGGLLLISKYPILETNQVTFRDASRVIGNGLKSDGVAAKGVLHARIAISDNFEIDCFLTHLESQQAAPREKQIKQMAEFVSAHTEAKRPAVLMGDFNIVGPKSRASDETTPMREYETLINSLLKPGWTVIDTSLAHAANGNCGGTSDALRDDGGERIDYIFTLHEQTSGRQLDCKRTRMRDLRSDEIREGSLSDHRAVACELKTVAPAHQTGNKQKSNHR